MRTSKLRHVVAVTGTLFGSSLAAACGGSDSEPAPTTTTAQTAEPSTPSTPGSAKDGGASSTTKPPANENTGSGAQSW